MGMRDVSESVLAQSRFFNNKQMQQIFDKYVLNIEEGDSAEIRADKKFTGLKHFFLESQTYGEELNKLDQVGKFIDIILNLKQSTAQLEGMIAKTVDMMYAKRALIQDMNTCNKVLYILQTAKMSGIGADKI